MSALLVAANPPTAGVYTVPQRTMLEARWSAAGRDLDDARRHVEIAVGLLRPMLPHDLLDAFVANWLHRSLAELDALDLDGELPRGGER